MNLSPAHLFQKPMFWLLATVVCALVANALALVEIVRPRGETRFIAVALFVILVFIVSIARYLCYP